MRELYTKLSKRFPLGELTEQRHNLAFLSIDKEQLRPLLLHLRDKENFSHLVLLTAVDWLEDHALEDGSLDEQKFQLTYLLSNRNMGTDIGLRVMISRKDAVMESIHDIWPTAATYQRELREMFGIDFPDSPGVYDDFILEGWNNIPPYRRDFDTLKFSQDTFSQRPGRETKDPAQHMKQQLYPDGA